MTPDRKAVEAIVAEARRIRSTLESLSRVSRSRADQPAAISVSELLTDMEQLYRPEFLQRSIEFQVNVAPGLPRILCGAQQLRQAVLHCLQFAIGAVEREGPAAAGKAPKTIRLEAARGMATSCRSPSATPVPASCTLSVPSTPLFRRGRVEKPPEWVSAFVPRFCVIRTAALQP